MVVLHHYSLFLVYLFYFITLNNIITVQYHGIHVVHNDLEVKSITLERNVLEGPKNPYGLVEWPSYCEVFNTETNNLSRKK